MDFHPLVPVLFAPALKGLYVHSHQDKMQNATLSSDRDRSHKFPQAYFLEVAVWNLSPKAVRIADT
jgi:hypothetical protein